MRIDAALPSQGCCDGSNTTLAAAGVPNIDTLGVQGGKIHSSDEFMYVSSFTARAKLSTLTLLQLADGALSDHWVKPDHRAAQQTHTGDTTP